MALAPASHLITDNQDLRAAGDLSVYLVFQSLNSINNLCKGGVVKQKKPASAISFEFGSAAHCVTLGKVSAPGRQVRMRPSHRAAVRTPDRGLGRACSWPSRPPAPVPLPPP